MTGMLLTEFCLCTSVALQLTHWPVVQSRSNNMLRLDSFFRGGWVTQDLHQASSLEASSFDFPAYNPFGD